MLFLLATSCGNQTEHTPKERESERRSLLSDWESYPNILFTGHGVFFGEGGVPILPTQEIVLAKQIRLIKKWSSKLETEPKISYELSENSLTQNYIFLRNLFDQASVEQMPYVTDWMVLDALDGFYQTPLKDNEPQTQAFAINTEVDSLAYQEECRAQGVPVPDLVLDSQWINHGVLEKSPKSSNNFDFLDKGVAELWSWESSTPDGICVALPRWKNGKAKLFGIICLGRQSNKVCYFDNKKSPDFLAKRYQGPYEIQNFVGGFELITNGGGECTDCHAGENPFIVHPDDKAFKSLQALRINPAAWPEPIVYRDWYQNPYPLRSAQFPSSPNGSCLGCHGDNTRIRFPALSLATSGYCDIVLQNAIQSELVAGKTFKRGRTMPPSPNRDLALGDPALFDNHIQFLLDECNRPSIRTSPTGTIVFKVPDDDPGFLSPPIVGTPLYTCAQSIFVNGALLNATVEVSVNGQVVGQGVIRDPNGISFPVQPLEEGDVVRAVQRLGGVTSAPSFPVQVYNHEVDFPDKLPAPSFGEKTYECGQSVAVNAIIGARLSFRKNGRLIGSFRATGKRTSANIGSALAYNDELKMNQRLCADTSDFSKPSYAGFAPSPMPQVNVSDYVIGQEVFWVSNVLSGSEITINASAGQDSFTWGWSVFRWNHTQNFGVPYQGNGFSVAQALCENSIPTMIQSPLLCEELEPPLFENPVNGQNYINIIKAMPGARIRVYDKNDIEIGDGSGATILLSRAVVTGEEILVVQDLLAADCIGQKGRKMTVQPGQGNPINGQSI